MKRAVWGGSLLLAAAAVIGCSMCQSPYDYSGAVVTPNGQPTTGFAERQGSVLQGGPRGGVAQAPTPANPEAEPAGNPDGVPTPAGPDGAPAAPPTVRRAAPLQR